MPHRRPVATVVSSAALLLATAACSVASEESRSAEPSPPPLSAEWQCEDVPESPDGKYDVARAGSVSITRSGEDLSPVGAAARADYGDAETRLYDSAAEVEFRHRTDGSRVLFRVDVHGGERKVQICQDQR